MLGFASFNCSVDGLAFQSKISSRIFLPFLQKSTIRLLLLSQERVTANSTWEGLVSLLACKENEGVMSLDPS